MKNLLILLIFNFFSWNLVDKKKTIFRDFWLKLRKYMFIVLSDETDKTRIFGFGFVGLTFFYFGLTSTIFDWLWLTSDQLRRSSTYFDQHLIYFDQHLTYFDWLRTDIQKMATIPRNLGNPCQCHAFILCFDFLAFI